MISFDFGGVIIHVTLDLFQASSPWKGFTNRRGPRKNQKLEKSLEKTREKLPKKKFWFNSYEKSSFFLLGVPGCIVHWYWGFLLKWCKLARVFMGLLVLALGVAFVGRRNPTSSKGPNKKNKPHILPGSLTFRPWKITGPQNATGTFEI